MDAETLKALNTLHQKYLDLSADGKQLSRVEDTIYHRLDEVYAELKSLRKRMYELESHAVPNTGLVSPSFWRRMATVWGYWTLGYVIVAAIILVFGLLMANAGGAVY